MDYVIPAASLIIGLITGAVLVTAYLHTKFATKGEVRALSKSIEGDMGYIRGRVDALIDRLLK